MPINKITHVCLTHDKVRARNEKMLEDAKNGMSQEQLAEKYQICVSTVRYSLKDFYEEQSRQRKAKKKAWQTQMIHEYEMGAKSPELQENTASVERSFIGFFIRTERMADKSTAKTVSRLARKETPRWSGNTKTAFLSKSLRKNTGSKREAYIAP